jgi:hypothetical protein
MFVERELSTTPLSPVTPVPPSRSGSSFTVSRVFERDMIAAFAIPEFFLPTPRQKPDGRDVLRRAADIMEQRGHCQNTFMNSDGEVCTAMAIGLAINDPGGPHAWLNNPLFDAAWTRLMGFVYGLDPLYWEPTAGLSAVCSWNNSKGFTGDKIVAAMRAAAAA